MKVTSVNYSNFNYNLTKPLDTSQNKINIRKSLLINITFSNGLTITGEAAPLTGFSKESLEEVLENLITIIPLITAFDFEGDYKKNFNFINSICRYPSLNFALQTILLKYYIFTKNDPFYKPNKVNIKMNGLISINNRNIDYDTKRLVKEGFKTIKYKIGIEDFDIEYSILKNILNNNGDSLNIRIDPNSSINKENLLYYFDKLNLLKYEYIEDPVNNLNDLNIITKYTPKIALDSTLFNIKEIEYIIEQYGIKYFIIKPTLQGNLFEIFNLFTNPKYSNINFIISSTFESYYSAYILFYLAALRIETTHGLSTFKMLDCCSNNYIYKEDTCIVDLANPDFVTSTNNYNINNLEIFTNLNKNNNNVLFVNKNVSITYNNFYYIILRNNLSQKNKKLSDCNVSIYESSTIDLIKNIFYLWSINSNPIIFDYRIGFSNSEELAIKFNVNALIAQDTINYYHYNPIVYTGNKLILFTSGSTGLPKAVIVSLDSIIKSSIKFIKYFNVTKDNSFIASLPVNHIGGLMIIFRGIISGSKIFIPESTNYKDLLDIIINNRIDFISLVPKQLQDLLDNNVDLTRCKAVILGGAKSDSKLIKRALERGINLYKVYGSSETCSMVTIASPDDLKQNPLSSGKPFSDVQVFINKDNNLLTESNIKGEVVIKSDTLYSAYLNTDLREYSENKIGDYYYTKDYGFIDDDGSLIIEARIDDIIISGGENISPEEIRKAILEIEEIDDAIVIGIEDKKWGQVPIAFIKTNIKINAEFINDYLKRKLPKFKIPKRYIFIAEIPYNNNGKIDKHKLISLI